eukprot:3066132-Alexandrium_andersonii.AAC.1
MGAFEAVVVTTCVAKRLKLNDEKHNSASTRSRRLGTVSCAPGTAAASLELPAPGWENRLPRNPQNCASGADPGKQRCPGSSTPPQSTQETAPSCLQQ